LDALRRCIPASIRKALDELPITLDETYERTLQCIPKEQRGHAHRLFQCLIAAVRPLRLEELTEIFAIQFDSNTAPNLVAGWRPVDPEDAMLAACSSLITIVDVEDTKVVQFSHFSVKEFLVSERLAISNVGTVSQYHVLLEPAHTILAQACLAVLLQLGDKTRRDELTAFPLAFYAARHWVEHAKFENVSLKIADAMESLFNPHSSHLAAWIWIYDIVYVGKHSMNPHSDYPSPLPATPLYYAAFCGFLELAKHLISKHALDVNGQCQRGTPLHGTCYGKQLECMRLLLDHGADVTALDGLSFAALHLASMRGPVEAVRLLLQYNSDVDIRKGDSNMTPLHYASACGLTDVVELLLEHGANINTSDKDEDGEAPLYLASTGGHLDTVRLLLDHGANVHVRNTDSRWTSYYSAMFYGHHEIAQLLLEYGAQG
jgi:Ankyrin repeats (3 copies)/Ankyrin repeat